VEQFDEAVASQYGYLTKDQAVGYFGERAFKAKVANKELIREMRKIYRVAGVPSSPAQGLFLATFAYGGIGSHKGAAGLRDFERYGGVIKPEIIVAAGTGSRPRLQGLAVTIHRSNYLPHSHIEVVQGIAVTTAARTLCDLSRFLTAKSLGKIVDDAKRRHLVTYAELAKCRDELRVRGRRRITVLDDVLRLRGFDYDPGDSNPEANLRGWLEGAGLHPVVQHPVIVNGIRRKLDLAFPPEKVAVEYFGLDPHAQEVRVMDDSTRTTELQLAGWLVVIITKSTGRRRAVEMVKEALALRRQTRPD
jgi:hypothetical protein